MTTYNGIETPCFGSLAEIHAALVKDLHWLDGWVTINGTGYTIKTAGYQDNRNGTCQTCEYLALVHPGTAILTGQRETFDNEIFEIVTSGKVPHISKRCALCGMQLCQEDIPCGACLSCYSEEVGH